MTWAGLLQGLGVPGVPPPSGPLTRAERALSLCPSPSLPTSPPARASDFSPSPDGADAAPCSFLLGLILVRGRKGSECRFKFIVMHIVCHLCWFSWCFEVSLALVLCLRQNCLLLHCSCYFACFYVQFCFTVLPRQFGYNCMKRCFWFYPVTTSYRSHPLPCRKTLVWREGIGLVAFLPCFPWTKM